MSYFPDDVAQKLGRPTCQTCPFFHKFKRRDSLSVVIGECRHHSPRNLLAVGEAETTLRDFGELYSDDWCGDHPHFPEYAETFNRIVMEERYGHAIEEDSGNMLIYPDGTKIYSCSFESGPGFCADAGVLGKREYRTYEEARNWLITMWIGPVSGTGKNIWREDVEDAQSTP